MSKIHVGVKHPTGFGIIFLIFLAVWAEAFSGPELS